MSMTKCPMCRGKGKLSCTKCSGEGCSVYGIAANGPCTAGEKCQTCNGEGKYDGDNRTVAQVKAERKYNSMLGGCCDDYANVSGCGCLRAAEEMEAKARLAKRYGWQMGIDWAQKSGQNQERPERS